MKNVKGRVCHICGKTIKPRGIGGHIALAHKIREVEVVNQNFDSSGDAGGNRNETQNSPPRLDFGSRCNLSIAKPGETVKMRSTPTETKKSTEKNKDAECQLYTETDIKILLARMLKYSYGSVQPSQLLQHFALMEMVQDFEKRFKCEFENVRKLNQHISFGKSFSEHHNFIYQYLDLKYSR